MIERIEISPHQVLGVTIQVRRSGFWWSAIYPDEVLATTEPYTVLHSLSRERVIKRWRKRLSPGGPFLLSSYRWTEVRL